MRELKFRHYISFTGEMLYSEKHFYCLEDYFSNRQYDSSDEMQFTGLKDKNGRGLNEVYEGDIISLNGVIIGSVYEVNKRKTDLVIPQLGTKAWWPAYKEAVARGFNYSE